MCVCHISTHIHHFCIGLWRICQCTRKTLIKSNIIWRYYIPCTWYIHRIPFWCCGITTNMLRKPFCAWWSIVNTFLSTCAVAFRIIHVQNSTRKCDTEGFVPVPTSKYVVFMLSLFLRSLIGRTGKIWSVVYINAKWIYTSETLACDITECDIVRNILHVNLTCLFISWCYGAANI